MDKDLRIYSLNDSEWEKIEEILSILGVSGFSSINPNTHG
jgi:hypothetical protein